MINFAAFSTLFLLASTVTATPVNHSNGKWEHSRPFSSFASLDNVSAGFTMPSGTDTALVIVSGQSAIHPIHRFCVPRASWLLDQYRWRQR